MCVEASLGVLDLANLKLPALPRDLLDFRPVAELFLEGNLLTVSPPALPVPPQP